MKNKYVYIYINIKREIDQTRSSQQIKLDQDRPCPPSPPFGWAVGVLFCIYFWMDLCFIQSAFFSWKLIYLALKSGKTTESADLPWFGVPIDLYICMS
jgi:hypothetical protein